MPHLDKNIEFEYNDTNEFIIPEKDSQVLLKNYSINTYINNTFHNNIDNSIVTNNNALFIDNNKSNHADRLDPKNAKKK